MDFNDTPEEAAYRTEVRSWLEANAPKPTGSERRGEEPSMARSKAWQAKKAAAVVIAPLRGRVVSQLAASVPGSLPIRVFIRTLALAARYRNCLPTSAAPTIWLRPTNCNRKHRTRPHSLPSRTSCWRRTKPSTAC